jgi:hypothetical protein
LIARGARLVADDRAEVFARGGALWARPAARLAGLLEVRGVGIVSLPFAAEARVLLAVHLVPPADVPRLPEPRLFEPPAALGIEPALQPPLILLSPNEASAPEKVILAAANARLRN